MMIAVGIVLAALFVSGLSHPVSAQVPATVASHDSHHRWVVTGFVVSTVGVAILLATELLRRNQKTQQKPPSASPVA